MKIKNEIKAMVYIVCNCINYCNTGQQICPLETQIHLSNHIPELADVLRVHLVPLSSYSWQNTFKSIDS